MKAFDAMGIEIKVGDVVVYPGRRGSELWINFGVVQEILWKSIENEWPFPKGSDWPLKYRHEPELKVLIRTTKDKYRTVTLTELDRIVVYSLDVKDVPYSKQSNNLVRLKFEAAKCYP